MSNEEGGGDGATYEEGGAGGKVIAITLGLRLIIPGAMSREGAIQVFHIWNNIPLVNQP